jgi:hypothetical protein
MDLFSIFSLYFSDPRSYIEVCILIGVFKHEKCLIEIKQWVKDHKHL